MVKKVIGIKKGKLGIKYIGIGLVLRLEYFYYTNVVSNRFESKHKRHLAYLKIMGLVLSTNVSVWFCVVNTLIEFFHH